MDDNTRDLHFLCFNSLVTAVVFVLYESLCISKVYGIMEVHNVRSK